ncbi:MAG: hypothetical protein MUF49_00795 [Oculatellaceae cyanobacterium Prado106]|nr:hypothetical protein [Oculatellaceae cyanobacterium Prado106]
MTWAWGSSGRTVTGVGGFDLGDRLVREIDRAVRPASLILVLMHHA